MKLHHTWIGTLGTVVLNVLATSAQNLSYGADNFYQSDNVTTWPITFRTVFDTEIAANLYIPDSLKMANGSNYSALVVSHPFGAVKEQSANLYATKMAEQDFVTLSFDMPFWGGSSPNIHGGVLPDLYAEAFRAAVDHLGTLGFVDRHSIGGIGICGSGGFIIGAAKLDPRLSAIATVSMYDMGGAARNGIRNALSTEARKESITASAEQRWAEVDGAETELSLGNPLKIDNSSTAIEREFYDFYRTSRGRYTPAGSMPNITTGSTVTTYVKLMNFYPFNDIETISPRPLLFISGDQAHSREFSEDAYERANEPKELFWVEGAGHVDLYDRTELIPFGKLTDFFRTNLHGN